MIPYLLTILADADPLPAALFLRLDNIEVDFVVGLFVVTTTWEQIQVRVSDLD